MFWEMLNMSVSPNLIATSSALGIFLAFSPYFGLHTILALTIAHKFKLPMLPTIIGVNINNPLTAAFIYAFSAKIGMNILNFELPSNVDWSDITFKELITYGKPVIGAFFLGTHLIGVILAVFTYFFVYYIVKAYRKKLKKKLEIL
jgi:uncharacterized protein (DUF2062 family)